MCCASTSMVPGAAETVAAIHGARGTMEGPSAIVRIPATSVSDSTSWQIKYALDAGARGLFLFLRFIRWIMLR